MQEHMDPDQLIAFHRNKMDYVESPPNSLQLAYGDHRYVKFTYELLRQHDILKLKILKELNDDFRLSNNITLALLSSDILSVLFKHFENPDDTIRMHSIEAVKQVCTVVMGREKVSTDDRILKIQKLLADKVVEIRRHAYQALLNFTETLQCKQHVNKTQILEDLVDKLLFEKNIDILHMTLQLIYNLLGSEDGTKKSLATEAIKRHLGLIGHADHRIREAVCANLAGISYDQTGKAQIIQKGGVLPIFERLTDSVPQVREQASLCLCSLAQLNDGKNQILATGKYSVIANLLNEKSKDTKLNIVQLIANLAEHPQGRELGKGCLSTLEGIKDIERTYIDATIEVIKWKP